MTPAAVSQAASCDFDPALAELVEQLTGRLQNGEAVDLEAVLAQHPEQTEALRQLLPALQALADLGGSAAPGGTSGPALMSAVGPMLGDYRIVRELGRGGMGVVYEAEQVSLGRRVALKVLPFAAAVDAKQLQRFKNEAQAAAQLHHTNIVPVYAVGCERGIHFFAMQYIDGRTLAAVIDEMRQFEHDDDRPPARDAEATQVLAGFSTERSARNPGYFRTVTQLGVQAAEALEYAHQHGVIHRDIKPANLLVDARGNLWVTDFGLAHFHQDVRLTASGDVLGSLRYMSPEQALGKRGLLDHRTDVYALGVTLYELLTLQPAVPGADRQAVLRRLALDEPAPARRVNPAIPVELETILLKATAKNPAERYGSAGELADDLRRFLADKPVLARRPTVSDRLRKWARRHRTGVAAGSVILAAAVGGLILSLALIWSEKVRTEGALKAEADQRRRADEKQRQARQAVDEMYTQVAVEWLAHAPHLEAVHRNFLEKALAFYVQFAQEPAASADARLGAAKAWRRVGEIQERLGSRDAAEKAFQEALHLLDTLEADPAVRRERALVHSGYGQLLGNQGKLDDAEKQHRQARFVREKLAEEFPNAPEHRHELGNSLGHLAELHRKRGEWEAACRLAEEAVTHQQAALDATADKPAYRDTLGKHYCQLAGALVALSRMEEAVHAARQAVAIHEQVVQEGPRKPYYRADLAASYRRLGGALERHGNVTEADAALRKAVAEDERLAADFPTAPAYRANLASSYEELAYHLKRAHKLRDAEKTYRAALDALAKLPDESLDLPALRRSAASCRQQLAEILADTQRDDEAEQSHREAVRALETLVADYPAVVGYRAELARAQNLAGLLLHRRGKLDDAEQAHRAAIGLFEQLGRDYPKLPRYRTSQAGSLHNQAWVCLTRGDAAAARPLLERALMLQQKALHDDPKSTTAKQFLRNHSDLLARCQARLGDHAAAAKTVEELPRLVPDGLQEHYRLYSVLTRCARLAAEDKALPVQRQQELIRAYASRAAEAKRLAHEKLPAAEDAVETCNRAAWLLITVPEAEFRDAEKALALARSAVERRPNVARYLTCLGAACYRHGDWRDAVNALEQANKLRKGGDGANWFFLSMASLRLGDMTTARAWFDKAVSWMATHAAGDESLRELRTEAEATLR